MTYFLSKQISILTLGCFLMLSYPVESHWVMVFILELTLINLGVISFFSLKDSLVAEDLSQMGRDTIASLIAGIIQRNSLTSEVGCSVV